MGLDVTGFGSVFDFAGKVIDKIFPNKDDAEKAKLAMYQLQQQGAMQEIDNEFKLNLEQIKTNAVQAASGNFWVAGGRPFIMWVCGFSLAYNYILFPFYVYTAKLFYSVAPAMPVLDNSALMTILLTLLGIGGMRSYDKVTATKDPCSVTPIAPKG